MGETKSKLWENWANLGRFCLNIPQKVTTISSSKFAAISECVHKNKEEKAKAFLVALSAENSTF